MAKAKSIQTTNTNLLYARVVRADGTKTFINKVNANGYGTDAKGTQIPKTRIVQAGRVLKELPEVLNKGEFVLVGGIAHKLNKREQKMLLNGDDDFVGSKSVDLDRLQFVEPDAATTSRRAVRHTDAGHTVKPTAKRARKTAKAEGIEVDMLDKDSVTSAKVDRKRALISQIDNTLQKANSAQLKVLANAFDMKVKPMQALGGKGIVKHLGLKETQAIVKNLTRDAVDGEYIKQMPRELKRLMQDRELVLNRKQIEQVLSVLGLDAMFYAVAIEKHFDQLRITLPAIAAPAVKERAVGKQRPLYAQPKELKKLLGKLKTKLIAPTAKFLVAHKKRVKEVRAFWQQVFGLKSPNDVKRGLLVLDDYGDKYALVAIDHVSTVFVRVGADGERLIAHSMLNLKSGHGKFSLATADELDATA